MKLSTAAGIYLLLQITTLSINVHGQCSEGPSDLPKVTNGYLSDTGTLKFVNGKTSGYYINQCNPTYSFNPPSDGRITCLDSGTWSPTPTCQLDFCLVSDVFSYILTVSNNVADGTSYSSLNVDSNNQSRALHGASVAVQCKSGFQNVGGPLTIVCVKPNTWSPFPQCVPNAASGNVAPTPAGNVAPTPAGNVPPTTQAAVHNMAPAAAAPATATRTTAAPTTAAPTTAAPTTAAPPVGCPASNSSLIFANGYVTNGDNIKRTNDHTTDTVLVSCNVGYVVDTVSNGVYTCNNGVWSARPSCNATARCPFQKMIDYLEDPDSTMGLAIDGQDLSSDDDDESYVIQGSSITFECQDPYVLKSGQLHVTCNADSKWSDFPICVNNNAAASSDAQ